MKKRMNIPDEFKRFTDPGPATPDTPEEGGGDETGSEEGNSGANDIVD